MGRRKIEIQPIEEDRNRTVTFVKRKAGLFKKAHELAVLCSVDVSVIIIGHNRKIYEYCSDTTRDVLEKYYDAPTIYEHKSPSDYGPYETKSRVAPLSETSRKGHRRIASSTVNPLHNSSVPKKLPNDTYPDTSMEQEEEEYRQQRKKRKIGELQELDSGMFPQGQGSSSPSFSSAGSPSPTRYNKGSRSSMSQINASSPSFNSHITTQMVGGTKGSKHSKNRPALSLQIPNSEQAAQQQTGSATVTALDQKASANGSLSGLFSGLPSAYRNQSISLTPLVGGSGPGDRKLHFPPGNTPLGGTLLQFQNQHQQLQQQHSAMGQPLDGSGHPGGNGGDKSNLSTPISATIPMFGNLPQLSPTQLLPTSSFSTGQSQESISLEQAQAQQQFIAQQLQQIQMQPTQQQQQASSIGHPQPLLTQQQAQQAYQMLGSANTMHVAGFASKLRSSSQNQSKPDSKTVTPASGGPQSVIAPNSALNSAFYSQFGQFQQGDNTPVMPAGGMFASPSNFYAPDWPVMGTGNTPISTTAPHLPTTKLAQSTSQTSEINPKKKDEKKS